MYNAKTKIGHFTYVWEKIVQNDDLGKIFQGYQNRQGGNYLANSPNVFIMHSSSDNEKCSSYRIFKYSRHFLTYFLCKRWHYNIT